MSAKAKRYRFYIVALVCIVAAYFVNVEVQTYLGEKALENSGLIYYDLDQAMKLAASEQKLVFADMSAIWCPSCRSLDKTVFSDQRVQAALNERFIFARVEYESEAGKAFQKKYNVSGFPVLLILDAEGNKLKQVPVTMDVDAFIGHLSSGT